MKGDGFNRKILRGANGLETGYDRSALRWAGSPQPRNAGDSGCSFCPGELAGSGFLRVSANISSNFLKVKLKIASDLLVSIFRSFRSGGSSD
jgi:hypothetical protein